VVDERVGGLGQRDGLLSELSGLVELTGVSEGFGSNGPPCDAGLQGIAAPLLALERELDGIVERDTSDGDASAQRSRESRVDIDTERRKAIVCTLEMDVGRRVLARHHLDHSRGAIQFQQSVGVTQLL